MNDDVHLLKGIGLTMYEAQAYVTLTSLQAFLEAKYMMC